MKDQQPLFADLPARLPARLNSAQAAAILGIGAHDIAVLVHSKLLKPLGNPPKGSVKYFSSEEIMQKSQDTAWLAKATQTLYRNCVQKNGRAKERFGTNLYQADPPNAAMDLFDYSPAAKGNP
jgi:hypothetical protein